MRPAHDAKAAQHSACPEPASVGATELQQHSDLKCVMHAVCYPHCLVAGAMYHRAASGRGYFGVHGEASTSWEYAHALTSGPGGQHPVKAVDQHIRSRNTNTNSGVPRELVKGSRAPPNAECDTVAALAGEGCFRR